MEHLRDLKVLLRFFKMIEPPFFTSNAGKSVRNASQLRPKKVKKYLENGGGVSKHRLFSRKFKIV